MGRPKGKDRKQRDTGPAGPDGSPSPWSIADPHPFVAKTLKTFDESAAEEDGIVRPASIMRLDMRVSPGCLDRAIWIFDSLVKGLSARGIETKIDMSAKFYCRTYVVLSGDQYDLRLSETRLQSLTERDTSASNWRGGPRSAISYRPSGNLIFSTDPFNPPHEPGRGLLIAFTIWRWAEKDGSRLENKIDTIADWFVSKSASIITRREEAASREIALRESAAVEAEARRCQAEENERVARLDRELASWEKAKRIREYVAARRLAAESGASPIVPGSPSDAWLSWAAQHAESIDPN
jgi:hypothetical protein